MIDIRQKGKSKISIEEMDARGIRHDNGWVFGVYIDGYMLSDVVEATNEYIVIGQWCPVYKDSVEAIVSVNDEPKLVWGNKYMLKKDTDGFNKSDIVILLSSKKDIDGEVEVANEDHSTWIEPKYLLKID